MSENDSAGAPEVLDKRLRDARRKFGGSQPPDKPDDDNARFNLGKAWRIGVELVAALIVGVGLGWLIDRWLGTEPWGLLILVVLGFAAGLLNAYRAVMGIGSTIGWRRGQRR